MVYPLVFCLLNRIIGFAEDTHARKNLKNIWFFARLIVSLALPKILTLEKT
jgi:hypothetical protein